MKLLIVGVDDMCPLRMVSGPYWKWLIDSNQPWGYVHGKGTPEGPLPHSGPCWLSIYTGLTAEEHGVLRGGWTKGNNYGSLTVPTMWDKLSEKHEVGMMTMPVTWPAPKAAWSVAAGPRDWGVSCWPDDLLDNANTVWQVQGFASKKEGRENTEARAEMIEVEWNRIKLIETLPEVDILAWGTEFVGAFQHCVFGHEPVNAEAYKALGDMVQYLRVTHEPEQVVVVSDHGFSWRGTQHAQAGVYFFLGGWPWLGMPPGVMDLTEVAPLILEVMDCERIPMGNNSS